jgi:hypothetical protein
MEQVTCLGTSEFRSTLNILKVMKADESAENVTRGKKRNVYKILIQKPEREYL